MFWPDSEENIFNPRQKKLSKEFFKQNEESNNCFLLNFEERFFTGRIGIFI